MADSNKVLYARGKKQSYNNLLEKDSNTFYFLYDTRELYQGETLYTESVRFYTGALPENYATGIIYFNVDTGVGSVNDGQVWQNVINPSASVNIDYNDLTNIPIKNIDGNPVELTSLSTGIYTVNGTWTVIDGADVFDVTANSLFYIKNDSGLFKVTIISPDGISTIDLSGSSNPEDIVYDSVSTVNNSVEKITENLWGEL